VPVDLQQFWGKLGPNGAWHPAVCHMIDVGQVARRLADRVLGPNFRWVVARALGVREGDAGKWLSFLCALHDLGKVSPGFQAKCPEQFGPLAHLGFRRTTSDEGRHGWVTFEAVSAILRSRGFPVGTADTLAAALGGHHGSFPLPDGGSPGGGPYGPHHGGEAGRGEDRKNPKKSSSVSVLFTGTYRPAPPAICFCRIVLYTVHRF
jgi:CRISPR-associated endonuclease/helicase Cas3